jgi:hypothetical protein
MSTEKRIKTALALAALSLTRPQLASFARALFLHSLQNGGKS